MRLLATTLLMMTTACPAAAGCRAAEWSEATRGPGAAILKSTEAGATLRGVIDRHIEDLRPGSGPGGLAIALRIDGRTSFFSTGMADEAKQQPVTCDSLFNLASLGKVFDATLLAGAVRRGEVGLDEPVAKYVTELKRGSDIRVVTFGQLATHTSGLLLPQDHPPWPEEHYARSTFIDTLNRWRASEGHQPGKQHEYTHAGFILLHLALERRLGMPLRRLIEQRILKPLGMSSTALPGRGLNPRGDLDAALKPRAVQGHDGDGRPVGEPGDIQGYYLWPGTGQMFSSARDMATFLTANLGELPGNGQLQADMRLAHRARFPMRSNSAQALAWEVHPGSSPMVDKNGGLNNTSAYIGMVPSKRIGIVMLANRGEQDVTRTGRRILLELASGKAGVSGKAHPHDARM
jgi:beta-lactamase class C